MLVLQYMWIGWVTDCHKHYRRSELASSDHMLLLKWINAAYKKINLIIITGIININIFSQFHTSHKLCFHILQFFQINVNNHNMHVTSIPNHLFLYTTLAHVTAFASHSIKLIITMAYTKINLITITSII